MKKTLILLVYLIFALIGVTFAWMTQETRYAKRAVLSYAEEDERYLYIASHDIKIEVQIYDEDSGTYITNDLSNLFEQGKVVPNEPISFKILFTNSSSDVQKIDFQLAKITTTNVEIFDYLFFWVSESSGYSTEYSYYEPDGTFLSFGDNLEGSSQYYVRLLDGLVIPPAVNSVPTVITLDCYILLSRLAGEEFEDVRLEIGYFRAVL